MPQLVKGGKFVYGLSRVGTDSSIVIPPTAMEEYAFKDGDRVILMSGSRKSGGFGLASKQVLEKSALAFLIRDLTRLFDYKLPEGETIEHRDRRPGWTFIREGGFIRVPLKTLAGYSVKAGDSLVVGRGSYLAIAFIVRGPIMEEALRHPELEVFGG
jgi:hypothetical protein